MNNDASKAHQPPLFKVVKTFFTKLVKTNDEYPVVYYKKDNNFSKLKPPKNYNL